MSGYSLGIKELDEHLGVIREGTNLMMIGPPMSRKDELLDAILAHNLGVHDGVIIVSTREPGERVVEGFAAHGINFEVVNIGIVDCVTKTLGMNAPDTAHIKRASSPVDLTGIGVKISQFFEDFLVKRELKNVRLTINSLSTILMYSNLQTVFRFLHVFTGRVKAASGFGIFVVEDEMHDVQTIATLKQLFDGLIEIKEFGDSYAMRVVGMTAKPTPWYEYDIEGTNIKLSKPEQ